MDHFTNDLPNYLRDLRELVELETPTRDVEQAGRAAAWLAERFSPYANVETEMLTGFGPMLKIHRSGTGTRVLLLAHYDTVWRWARGPTRGRSGTAGSSGPASTT